MEKFTTGKFEMVRDDVFVWKEEPCSRFQVAEAYSEELGNGITPIFLEPIARRSQPRPMPRKKYAQKGEWTIEKEERFRQEIIDEVRSWPNQYNRIVFNPGRDEAEEVDITEFGFGRNET